MIANLLASLTRRERCDQCDDVSMKGFDRLSTREFLHAENGRDPFAEVESDSDHWMSAWVRSDIWSARTVAVAAIGIAAGLFYIFVASCDGAMSQSLSTVEHGVEMDSEQASFLHLEKGKRHPKKRSGLKRRRTTGRRNNRTKSSKARRHTMNSSSRNFNICKKSTKSSPCKNPYNSIDNIVGDICERLADTCGKNHWITGQTYTQTYRKEKPEEIERYKDIKGNTGFMPPNTQKSLDSYMREKFRQLEVTAREDLPKFNLAINRALDEVPDFSVHMDPFGVKLTSTGVAHPEQRRRRNYEKAYDMLPSYTIDSAPMDYFTEVTFVDQKLIPGKESSKSMPRLADVLNFVRHKYGSNQNVDLAIECDMEYRGVGNLNRTSGVESSTEEWVIKINGCFADRDLQQGSTSEYTELFRGLIVVRKPQESGYRSQTEQRVLPAIGVAATIDAVCTGGLLTHGAGGIYSAVANAGGQVGTASAFAGSHLCTTGGAIGTGAAHMTNEGIHSSNEQARLSNTLDVQKTDPGFIEQFGVNCGAADFIWHQQTRIRTREWYRALQFQWYAKRMLEKVQQDFGLEFYQ